MKEKYEVNNKVKFFLTAMISAGIVLAIYILLHEGGHTLVAALCGAEITEFSFFGAHMSYTGGIFSQVTLSLLHAAGMLLPVSISIIYLIMYRRKIESSIYRIFSFLFIVLPLCSLLAWVFVPIQYMMGIAPVGEDVTKFISCSGIHPLAVTISALLLISLTLLFAWKKGVIKNYINTIK